MFSAFHQSLPSSCQRLVLERFYSSTIRKPLTQRNWQIVGPRPPSLLDDSDDAVDLSEDDEVVNGTRPGTAPLHRRNPSLKPTPHEYASHRKVMKETFPEGWSPPRKLSREAMDGLRELHNFDQATFSTSALAERFRISPEAVRRILKSKWVPTREQRTRFAEREKQMRLEWIKDRRAQENARVPELALQADRRKPDRRNVAKDESVLGADLKDKLYFQ